MTFAPQLVWGMLGVARCSEKSFHEEAMETFRIAVFDRSGHHVTNLDFAFDKVLRELIDLHLSQQFAKQMLEPITHNWDFPRAGFKSVTASFGTAGQRCVRVLNCI